MTQAAFAVEVIGEIIRKDGRKIVVTNKAIPQHIQLLLMLILNESGEDISESARIHEEMLHTFYKIVCMK